MTSTDFEAIDPLMGRDPLSFNPQRSGLIVVHMQRCFVEPHYPFSQAWAKLFPGTAEAYSERLTTTVIPNIQRLLERSRELAMPIYFLALGSLREDGRDLPAWARRHNTLSTKVVGSPMYPSCDDPGWQIHDGVAPAPGEQVVATTSSGPLNSTKLDQTLHLLGLDTLIVTGVATNVCVTQTAREFADRGFEVVIAEDACATPRMDTHHPALETFAFVFGRVSSTASVLEALSG